MELVLIHITDIHLGCEDDYRILEDRSEYIVKAINTHIMNQLDTFLVFLHYWRYCKIRKRRTIFICIHFFDGYYRRYKEKI